MIPVDEQTLGNTMITIGDQALATRINSYIVSTLWCQWDGRKDEANYYWKKVEARIIAFADFCDIKVCRDPDNGLPYGVEINGKQFLVDFCGERKHWEATRSNQ